MIVCAGVCAGASPSPPPSLKNEWAQARLVASRDTDRSEHGVLVSEPRYFEVAA